MKKLRYVVVLTSPSHHLMNEPYDYIKPYIIQASSQEEFDYWLDKITRKFSLEFDVALSNVSQLLTYKIRN